MEEYTHFSRHHYTTVYGRAEVSPTRIYPDLPDKPEPVFQITDIRATGLSSLSPVILDFFGTGMTVERLKEEGTPDTAPENF